MHATARRLTSELACAGVTRHSVNQRLFDTVHCTACTNTLMMNTRPDSPPVLVFEKMRRLGWTPGKKPLCPDCTNPRKEAAVKTAANPIQLVTKEVPATNFAAVRKVCAELEDHYRADQGCYAPDWSDERVAKELDLSAAFVAKIREEAFGPLKPPKPAEVVALEKDLATIKAELNAIRGMLIDLEGRQKVAERSLLKLTEKYG